MALISATTPATTNNPPTIKRQRIGFISISSFKLSTFDFNRSDASFNQNLHPVGSAFVTRSLVGRAIERETGGVNISADQPTLHTNSASHTLRHSQNDRGSSGMDIYIRKAGIGRQNDDRRTGTRLERQFAHAQRAQVNSAFAGPGMQPHIKRDCICQAKIPAKSFVNEARRNPPDNVRRRGKRQTAAAANFFEARFDAAIESTRSMCPAAAPPAISMVPA